jgi:fructose-specific phosphotransferase system IIA component
MKLESIILPELVSMELQGTGKTEVIEELIGLLVRAGRVEDAEAALKTVMDREAKLSTGMGNGVAIPHGKTNQVSTISAAVGISRAGVNFESTDGNPCNIIVLTLSPTSQVGPHIEFLATITRRLNSEDFRQPLRDAASPAEVVAILCS